MNADNSGLWLSVDPGEDTGWALWRGNELVDAGTAKLWEMADAVWDAVFTDEMELEIMDAYLAMDLKGITGIVCENFVIYPWEAKRGALDWDSVRTVRLIGALQMIAKRGGLWWRLQGAKIKEDAKAAGAEVFFLSPLHENRHANDAIMHGVYFDATKDRVKQEGFDAPTQEEA